MTNKEKLLKLLQIAVQNGWKAPNQIRDWLQVGNDSYGCDSLNACTISIKSGAFPDFSLRTGFATIPLNDLVTNFEYEEKCFIKQLVVASEKIHKNVLEKQDDITQFEDLDLWENVVKSWTTKRYYCRFKQDYKLEGRPTSKRLDWLFETFKHLL